MKRNIITCFIMWIIELAFYFLYPLFLLNVFDCDVDGNIVYVFYVTWSCIAFFIIPFLTGRIFIKRSDQIKKDLLPLLLMNSVVFVIFAVVFKVMNDSVILTLIWFAAIAFSSLSLWLGMLSKKKKSTEIKQGI